METSCTKAAWSCTVPLDSPVSSTRRREWGRWAVVVVFAIAMAWVESAVVFYLRTLVDRIEPYQTRPLPVSTGLGRAELVRETATLVMLLAVGWLAGRSWPSRLGYSLIAFGVWDIFYYVFLKVITGWPRSLLDWDILFLLPLPWWGPVWAPASIAVLMIAWGTLVSQCDRADCPIRYSWRIWGTSFFGISLALYVFMADAIRVVGRGPEALRNMLLDWFNWPLFAGAVLLMAAPVIDASRQIRSPRSKSTSKTGLNENSPL